MLFGIKSSGIESYPGWCDGTILREFVVEASRLWMGFMSSCASSAGVGNPFCL
jgi:hypothetical protein